MRKIVPAKLEQGRILTGRYGSDVSFGLTGAFEIYGPNGRLLRIISDGGGETWEHVSVSLTSRTPNWGEMCFVKDLFWDEDEVVIQIHPKRSEYVNIHPNCLHLWKPVGVDILMPPKEMVG